MEIPFQRVRYAEYIKKEKEKKRSWTNSFLQKGLSKKILRSEVGYKMQGYPEKIFHVFT